MCVNANAWPFSPRISRSSVAEVTGEIRDGLRPLPGRHPSSSRVHVCPCVCTGVDIYTHIYTQCVDTLREEMSRRLIKRR